jgi:hypothetical protein
MNVDEYMDRDFSLLQKRVNDARKAYEQQDPSRTMTQAGEMFDAFGRRFALEDFLLNKVHQTCLMKQTLEKFLSRRAHIHELLEDMLMLHVSEPDFMRSLKRLISESEEYLQFLHHEFKSHVLDQITEADRKNISHALEDRLHKVAF